MDDKLYLAATEGNRDYLTEIENALAEGVLDERYFLGQTSEGDNLVHVAARRDRLSFIVNALEKIPAVVLLIRWGNNQGENPLHIAARLGQLDMVQLLVTQYKSHLNDIREKKVRSTLLTLLVTEKGTASPEPWRAQDSNGNTPLHEALKHGYEEVAMYLLEIEPELATYVNNANEGVLYLAAAYGHLNVLEAILTSTTTYSLSAPVGLTPLHVAVDTCTEGATKLLLQKHPELAKSADKRKRTALYYAAQTNKHGQVEAILNSDKASAYIRDETGLSPLLRAASLGQTEALQAILLRCPETVTICDNYGKTALHLIEFRSYEEGMDLLRIPAMKRLINKQDSEGNTPLHTAVRNCDYILAKVILDTDKTGATIENKEGFTPWDIIKLKPELTEQMAEIGYQLLVYPSDEKTHPQVIEQLTPRPDDINERLRRNFNTLGLMAVILAAITFAAGYVSAGGFDSNGYVILTRHTVFKVFIISNTAAMSGYTIVFFSTLSAMMIVRRDDEPMFLLSFCIHVLQLAFLATLTAFVSGIYALTSSSSLWLAVVVVCLPSCAVLTISKSFVLRLTRFFYRTRFY